MENYIKKVNMQVVYESLMDFELPKTEEQKKKIENLCIGIEDMSEFKNLFFFSDRDRHEYFYQAKDEQTIKDFFEKHFDISILDKFCLINIGQEMVDDEYGCFVLGNIQIDKGEFYTWFKDVYLTEQDNINELVEAGENFYRVLNDLKKECLECRLEEAITEAREELEEFEF